LDFVPQAEREQIIPCRHIPLNEAGQTLESLYNMAKEKEIEDTLREWLKRKIGELQDAIRSEPDVLQRKAG
jgi:predicted RNA binding protein with dsRBD fold (UPF0201 family)